MAKAVRTIGKIVGTVVTVIGIVTANPALVAAGQTITKVSGVVAGVIDTVAPRKPKFSGEGSPLRFATDPQSGIPYAMGRTRMSGVRIYAETTKCAGWDKDDLLSFGVLLSGGGQVDAIESFTADNELVTFDGAGNAIGRLHNYMSQKTWLGGAMSSALSLSLNGVAAPGWSSAHKLSGITHGLWSLRYDSKGNLYSAGVPEPVWIGRWVKVYDPRKDSTYPGGSGTHRALNEATYEWSRNPALHALTWCLGRWQNGKRTLGIGAPAANIRVADFVEAANIADANKWWIGGVEWSTDSKWDVLKRMLQAGGAVPTMTGAMIGCRVQAPRVSIATITAAHLLEKMVIPATKPRRSRFNTVIPRYRSEANDWQIISGTPISVSSYVTADGGPRTREIDYPLVQHEVSQTNVDGNRQAGQLAAYDIVDSREAGPISFVTGPQFIGLKTGDCVTLDVPGEGLSAQTVVLTSVALDPATARISFTADTETASKHAFALGQTTTPPPAFSLTPPALLPPVPDSADWSLAAALGADGLPVLRLHSAVATASWQSIIAQYRKGTGGAWTQFGIFLEDGDVTIDIPGVDGASGYYARVAYQGAGGTSDWLELGPVTTGASGVANSNMPLGSNLVVNSEFTNGLTGWSAGWNGDVALPVTRGIDLAGSPSNWYGAKHVAYATVTGTPAAGKVFDAYYAMGPGSSNLDQARKWAVPVLPGERLYYSALVAGHRCNVLANLQYWDANGTYLTEVVSATAPVAGPNFANGDPANATRVGAFHTVPNNARFAFLNIRAICPGGQANPYIFFSNGFIAKVDPNQTVAPPYMPGPGDRRADVTGENTANNTANVGAKTTAQLLSDLSAAQTEASNAAIDASDAQIRIQNIVADNVLDKSEKPDVVQRYSMLTGEQAGIDTRATAYGITTEKTAYDNAVAALTSYLTGLSPAYNSYTTDTPINRTTFNQKFTDVTNTRSTLLNKIAERAGLALNPDGTIKTDMVATDAIQDDAILRQKILAGEIGYVTPFLAPDTAIGSAGSYDGNGGFTGGHVVFDTPFYAVSDAAGGAVHATLYATFDSYTYGPDGSCKMWLIADTGAGWGTSKYQMLGVGTSSGNTYTSMSCSIAFALAGVQNVRFRLFAAQNSFPAGSGLPTFLRNINLAMTGLAR